MAQETLNKRFKISAWSVLQRRHTGSAEGYAHAATAAGNTRADEYNTAARMRKNRAEEMGGSAAEFHNNA